MVKQNSVSSKLRGKSRGASHRRWIIPSTAILCSYRLDRNNRIQLTSPAGKVLEARITVQAIPGNFGVTLTALSPDWDATIQREGLTLPTSAALAFK